MHLHVLAYVGEPLPNVEDIFMFSGDGVLIRAPLTGLSESSEHEWRDYFCLLDIDAYCVSQQCELLGSEVAVKWPGISARLTFGLAKRTAEWGSLGGITRPRCL